MNKLARVRKVFGEKEIVRITLSNGATLNFTRDRAATAIGQARNISLRFPSIQVRFNFTSFFRGKLLIMLGSAMLGLGHGDVLSLEFQHFNFRSPWPICII